MNFIIRTILSKKLVGFLQEEMCRIGLTPLAMSFTTLVSAVATGHFNGLSAVIGIYLTPFAELIWVPPQLIA